MGAETLTLAPESKQPDFDLTPEELARLPLGARICAQLMVNETLKEPTEDLKEATAEIVRSTGSDHDSVTKEMQHLLKETDRHAKFTHVEQSEGGRRMIVTGPGLDFLHREIDKLR